MSKKKKNTEELVESLDKNLLLQLLDALLKEQEGLIATTSTENPDSRGK